MVTTATPQSGWGTGQLLETLTYLQLRRQGGEISYYRHDDGTEVDFVVQRDSGAELVQVSADITSSDTRKRELHALDAAMRVLRKKEATLVTLNADETVKVDAGTVKVRPFWMWALGIE